MADKQATFLKAPPVTNLVGDGSGHSPGIFLKWDMPASDALFGVEIWRGLNNNRSYASKVATVIGSNQYLDIVTPNIGYYYWIRGVNVYGKGSGDWWPDGVTAGLLCKDYLPTVVNTGYAKTFTTVSDGTWQEMERLTIKNPTSRPIRVTAIFTTTVTCPSDVLAQMRGRSPTDVFFSTPFYNIIGPTPFTVNMPMYMYIPANIVATPYEYYIEFWGPSDTPCQASRPGTVYNWYYEW